MWRPACVALQEWMVIGEQRGRRAHCARAAAFPSVGDFSQFLPWAIPPSARAGAASVARLSTLAARFGRKLRMLGKATLLIGYALTAFASGDRSQLAILREAALGARYALAALAAGFRREPPILRETAFLIRHCLATHAGDLALPLGVH